MVQDVEPCLLVALEATANFVVVSIIYVYVRVPLLANCHVYGIAATTAFGLLRLHHAALATDVY